MLAKHSVDLNQVSLQKFSRRQVAVDGAAHPVGVGPRPIGLLFRVSMGQRDLIDDVLRATVIGKRKHRNLGRRNLLIIVSYVGFEGAGVELDQMIEPRLSSVSIEAVLVTEKGTVLVVRSCASAERNRRKGN